LRYLFIFPELQAMRSVARIERTISPIDIAESAPTVAGVSTRSNAPWIDEVNIAIVNSLTTPPITRPAGTSAIAVAVPGVRSKIHSEYQRRVVYFIEIQWNGRRYRRRIL